MRTHILLPFRVHTEGLGGKEGAAQHQGHRAHGQCGQERCEVHVQTHDEVRKFKTPAVVSEQDT